MFGITLVLKYFYLRPLPPIGTSQPLFSHLPFVFPFHPPSAVCSNRHRLSDLLLFSTSLTHTSRLTCMHSWTGVGRKNSENSGWGNEALRDKWRRKRESTRGRKIERTHEVTREEVEGQFASPWRARGGVSTSTRFYPNHERGGGWRHRSNGENDGRGVVTSWICERKREKDARGEERSLQSRPTHTHAFRPRRWDLYLEHLLTRFSIRPIDLRSRYFSLSFSPVPYRTTLVNRRTLDCCLIIETHRPASWCRHIFWTSEDRANVIDRWRRDVNKSYDLWNIDLYVCLYANAWGLSEFRFTMITQMIRSLEQLKTQDALT